MVSMGRANYTQIAAGLVNESYNSAGGLFNIVMKEDSALDGKYAVFGKVIEGLNLIMDLEKVKTSFGDKPLEDVVMEMVTVNTFGVDFPEPERY